MAIVRDDVVSVEEAGLLKEEVEAEIVALLTEFNERTGLTITRVDIGAKVAPGDATYTARIEARL